jgi:glucuronosyltransferase
MRGILRVLTDHGHRVTVFTANPDGDRKNYTEVDLTDSFSSLLKMDIDLVERELMDHDDLINYVHAYWRNACQKLYEHEAFGKITNDSHAKFDVVFAEIISSECISYLSVLLNNVPLVYVSPSPLILYKERSVFGHYSNPVVVSHTLSKYSVSRTFLERFTNTLLHCYKSSLLQYKVWSIPKKYLQPFDLVEPAKPSIVFNNAHYITDSSRPLPPSVIQVESIHLDPLKGILNVSNYGTFISRESIAIKFRL